MATKKKLDELAPSPLQNIVKPKEQPKPKPDANIQEGAISPAPRPPTWQKGQIEVYTDENGVKNGIKLPDGRLLSGIPSKEVDFLARKYKGLTETPEGATSFKENRLEQEKQIATESTTPNIIPQLTPQEISTTGQFDENINPESVISNDEQLRNRYTDVLNNAMARRTNMAADMPGSLLALIPGSTYKKELINQIVKDPDRKNYINGYSNENNMNSIIRDIDLTDIDIENAKALAVMPGMQKQARETYRIAQAKKVALYTQLKIINQNDQKEYTSKGKDKMTEIESYWKSGKVNDDLEMIELLSGVQ